MKHGSLFSGIGGFDLAAEWMGWHNVFHCEWMPFPQKVLKHYWPEAISYHDITTTDFRQHHGKIDILTGGFPCQPYSAAGKRLGKNDARHLWPHMLRAIREISPRWVVGENVRGLTNWNGGLVFDEVQADLESAGYEVLPFLLPAVAVNAPHRRDRIWFVAYNDSDIQRSVKQREPRHSKSVSGVASEKLVAYAENPNNQEQTGANNSDRSNERGRNSEVRIKLARYGGNRHAADTDNERLERGTSQRIQRNARGTYRFCDAKSARFSQQIDWENFPTQSPICGGNDGLPAQLDGITFPKWRNESIKGYGNAIVPQVALQIFKAIEQYEAVTMPHSSQTSQTHKE